MIIMFFLVLLIVVFLVQAVAFVTLCERHLLGGTQQRVGPNKVSFYGVVQPLFDGVKLIKKEQLLSFRSSGFFFLVVPGFTFMVMYLEWFVMCYFFDFFSLVFGVLLFLCLIGFSVYSFLLGGIVSNSKYGFLGGLRSGNQSVSYEIVFSLFIISIIFWSGSYVFFWGGGFLFVYFYVFFFIMMLGELNRAPFDFSEGESELVSGYNVEFSSVSYALFYIGEYGSLLFFSMLFSLFFFWGSLLVFYLVFCLLIFVRSTYPRFRYDMMMGLFWFVLLPVSLYYLLFCFLFLV